MRFRLKVAISMLLGGIIPLAIVLKVEMDRIEIVANPEPLGDKDKIDDAKDGSTYSALHAAHHAMLRQFKESFGFHDLFLIEPVGGRIVYTVEKERDFGASLLTRPVADTAFGHAAKAMIAAKGQGAPDALADFEPYAPSYGEQAAFILFPVWNN